MKKTRILSFLLFILIGCGGTHITEEDFDNALVKTEALTNFTVEYSFSAKDSQYIIISKIDGDKYEMIIDDGPSLFRFEEDGKFYQIMESYDGEMVAFEDVNPDFVEFFMLTDDFLDIPFDYFEYVDGYLVSTETSSIFVDVEVKIKIIDGYIIERTFVTSCKFLGDHFISMRIFDIHETTVVLPEFEFLNAKTT